ncbi:hypothetical protein, partial [Candidatus Erwinia dacicola]|uniref:hypothetical protein n=1 Tax=Candidatus Erwinia dacicola TaxID=252393 RepID=UPI001C9958E9
FKDFSFWAMVGSDVKIRKPVQARVRRGLHDFLRNGHCGITYSEKCRKPFTGAVWGRAAIKCRTEICFTGSYEASRCLLRLK